MGDRKAVLIMVLFCFCLLVSTSGIAFASSENWVEVARLTGSRDLRTSIFTCNRVEWRIRWEVSMGHCHFPQIHPTRFIVITYPYPEGRVSNYTVDEIYEIGNGSGTHYIHDNAEKFYMKIRAEGHINSYTIIIEQDLNSIPEFPSWIILPLFLVATVSAIVFKKRLFFQRS